MRTASRGVRWLGGVVLIAAAGLAFVCLSSPAPAQPINPKVYKDKFDEAAKDAELVAKVRVLAAVCTASEGEAPAKTVTLELALQVLDPVKGAKKNDVLVVSRKVTLPSGPGPKAYGYMGAVRQFPFTPGVEGSIAMKWDNTAKSYTVLAGWVEMPNANPMDIPTEVGKAFVAGDNPKAK